MADGFNTPRARHKWVREKFTGRCTVCGLTYVDRPHPFGRQWFREWSRPNESGENIGKTPPCKVVGSKQPPDVDKE